MRECKVDGICSVYKIEERESRLVECLRGRLLAERRASQVAKQDADILRERVMELEINLKEEIEVRDKTENKLRILQKKLEALSTKISCCSSRARLSTEVSLINSSPQDPRNGMKLATEHELKGKC